MGGAPLPTTHVVTGALGTFSVKLPVLPSGGAAVIPSVYTGRVQAPERGTVSFAGMSVDFTTIGMTTPLGDIVLSDTGTPTSRAFPLPVPPPPRMGRSRGFWRFMPGTGPSRGRAAG